MKPNLILIFRTIFHLSGLFMLIFGAVITIWLLPDSNKGILMTIVGLEFLILAEVIK